MPVKYHNDIEQGSEEWRRLRYNYITGTDAVKLLRGADIDDLLDYKRKDTFTGNAATRRGNLLESENTSIFEAITGLEVHHTGFVTNDNYPLAGYSPDGLIGSDGILENKSFNEERHKKNSIRPEVGIVAQMQWGMFVANRSYGYLSLYNPDLSPEEAWFKVLIRRNEAIMGRFKELIG